MYGDLSYTINFKDEQRLAFGLKVGATFHNIGLSSIDVIDEGDPFFQQNIDEITPNIGTGIFY